MWRPLILRVRKWPWTVDGGGRIGIRQWVKDYKFTRHMQKNAKWRELGS